MGSKVKDMTKGNPWKLILVFALPLMLGNIFQQCYTLTDTLVVGQAAGVEALSALGEAEWIIWLAQSLVIGGSQGFGILIAQYFGAHDTEKLKKSTALSYIYTLLLSVVTAAVVEIFAKPILQLIRTPENIFDLSLLYLRIITAGIPITGAYNMLAGVLRSLGNSRTPLTAMIAASLTNIGLDILFVGVLHSGVSGAAYATLIAQLCAAMICWFTVRKIDQVKLHRKDFAFDRTVSKELFRLGTPVAVQNTIISVGGIVVQYVINGIGFVYVAGFTATNKLYGLLEVAATSYGLAVTTYVGQNFGAGDIKRVRKGVNISIGISLITSCMISACMFALGRPILSLFISRSSEYFDDILNVAFRYLSVMSAMLFVLYLLYVYRSALMGLGNTVIPLVSGFAELLMRISTALILPKIMGDSGIYFAEVAAWTGAEIVLMVSYYVMIKKNGKSAVKK